jgi:hypothetical protein
MKSLPTEEPETLLLQWFQHMRSGEFPKNGPVLQEKATTITLRLKTEDFKASNGWLDRSKKCHDITCKFLHGESVDEETRTFEGIPAKFNARL